MCNIVAKKVRVFIEIEFREVDEKEVIVVPDPPCWHSVQAMKKANDNEPVQLSLWDEDFS